MDETLPLVKERKKRAPNKFNYREHYYRPFGRLIISTQALNNEDVPYLLLKHNTALFSPIPKLRRTKISISMRALLNNYLEHNVISTELQKELTDDEQNLLKLAMYVAKIDGFIFQSKTIEDYIKKFNLLKGALVAGSNSDTLKTELKQIITILSNPIIKKISPEYADELFEIIDEM
jgi:hypothetical protein